MKCVHEYLLFYYYFTISSPFTSIQIHNPKRFLFFVHPFYEIFILSLKTKSFLKTYHSTIFLTNGRTFQLFSADLSKMRMRGCTSVDTSLRPVFSEDFQTFLTILPVQNEAAKEFSAQIVKRKVF